MNCIEAAARIGAHVDGETDWRETRALERHLASCADCAAKRDDLIALRTQLRREVPYLGAPPALRRRISARFASAPAAAPTRAARFSTWRGFAGGFAAGAAACVLGWFAVTALIAMSEIRDFARDAVAAHVRATLDERLLQVASSDQHTVKPWLSARLDYAPPVRDFAADGFALAGARIETFGSRRVAVLVYRYRLHTIDVFVRPAGSPAPAAGAETVRGFHVVRRAGDGMEWTAVSDASPEALSALVARLTAGG